MKNPDKNKATKPDKSKVSTDKPLAEKDEVKQAEDKQRKGNG